MTNLLSAALAAITFVPMYATPTASQLPVMAGAIAGVRVLAPPRAWLGDYLAPGDVPAIDDWLERTARQNPATTFVISSDMLAYGGLDPSRIPGVTEREALDRLQTFAHLRAMQPHASIAAFGTIMRLEPTAVVPVGPAATYSAIAQPPNWEYIWEYAKLHDPSLPGEEQRAQQLRSLVGTGVLDQYLKARERDRNVDLALLQLVANGAIDRLVIGQDDAGPVGLHVKDVRALQERIASLDIGDRAAVEPGADELGLALVARALAKQSDWTPRVAVRYSTPDGGATQDPLEYVPIRETIASLVRLCGGVVTDDTPDLTLYVRVPHATQADDDRLIAELDRAVAANQRVALVDLTFLTGSYDAQRSFVERTIAAGIAGKLEAYAGWNTTANSTGIALGEAIAAGAGRRTGTYDRVAHAEFMLDRYIDDYLYHDVVRPRVNAELAQAGTPDHSYLAPATWHDADARIKAELLPPARALAAALYPQYRVERLEVGLPWPRTFEIESTIVLATK